jgi:glycosyltransferase involved in cell wall biosynthesis
LYFLPDMSLSVVITVHNEPNLAGTLESLYATIGNNAEVILIDDCSLSPIADPSGRAKVIRMKRRIGVGAARTLGVVHATKEYVLLTDAHMRFPAGWFDVAMQRITGRSDTLHCGICLGMDSEHMDITKPRGVYCGGTINVLGPDRNNKRHTQVFEGIWNAAMPEDDAEIPCAYGASYFLPRELFLKLSPLEHLRSWGEDEIMLSMKCWLSGGEVRFIKGVQFGHIFRLPKERLPYRIDMQDRIYNKLFSIMTLTNPPLTETLLRGCRSYQGFNQALRLIEANWQAVEIERARNARLFTRDFQWVGAKFGLTIPG